MNTTSNKILSIAVAAILVLTMTPLLLNNSSFVKAANTVRVFSATHAFVDEYPNPIGVGQPLFIEMWLIEVDPLASENVGGHWQGYTVQITNPSGTSTTLGPFTASDISTYGVYYTPTVAGNYTLFFSFPGQLVLGSGYDTYYEPSNTTSTFTVQQAPITFWPETPLPTQYWTNPIDWQNQNWGSISGNYMGCGGWTTMFNYQPYTQDILAPHIMWSKPLAFGGQMGGGYPYNQTATSNFYTGKSYETFFNPPIIENGVLFYNKPSGIQPAYGVYAVDLRTGQQLWYSNATSVSLGWMETHHNPNEAGGIAYLWGVSGSTLNLYDPNTGNWILSVSGAYSPSVEGSTASSTIAVTGPNGELLIYHIAAINSTYGSITMWNSTLEVGTYEWNLAPAALANGWEWRPQTGKTIPYSYGVQLNATVPIFPVYDNYIGSTLNPSIQWVKDGVILTTTGTITSPQDYEMEAGYSATTGALLWDVNRSVAQSPDETGYELQSNVGNGVYTEYNKATLQYYGFSLTTGQQVWGPTPALPTPESTYNTLGTSNNIIFLSRDISGMYAYYLTNGSLAWVFQAPAAGLEEDFQWFPFEGCAPMIAGDLVFGGTGVTHGDQLFRGAAMYAVNATTGKEVWSLPGFWWCAGGATVGVVSDGYLVTDNGYDNQIYCIGKGPSQTSVTAANPATSVGAPEVIRGTVYDIAAGSKENQVAANYPNGLPCVSDASESQFMAAVYEQQSMPNNVTGVPVTLSVIDPNGNSRIIGTTTSDASGMFTYTWMPDIPGQYTVIATFAGTNSYYGSTAVSSFYASSAPAATAAPTATPTSVADLYFVPAITGLFVLMIVVIAIVLALLMLRKKP